MCSRFRLFLYYKYKTDIKQAHYNQSALRFVEWHERGRAMHSGKVLCTQSSLVTAVNADRPAPDSQLRRSDTWVKKCMRIRQFHSHAQPPKVKHSGGPLNNQTWQTNGWPQQKLPEFGFSAHTLPGLSLISVFLSWKDYPVKIKVSIYIFGHGAVFHSVCQVWLSSGSSHLRCQDHILSRESDPGCIGPPEIFTFSDCAWLWNWLTYRYQAQHLKSWHYWCYEFQC